MPHAEPFAAAHRLLESAIADHVSPGAAYGIAYRNQQTLAAAGHFTYAAGAPAVTPSTLYDLASLTKIVATTSLAMLLFDRGLLALDAPLQTILPAFNPSDDATRRRVTLRLLLAHSSGLPAHEYLHLRCRTRAEALAACLSLPLVAAPGTVCDYSDIGFILLGLALEALAAEPLDRICARELFAPLAMSSTCFNPPPELRPHIPPTGFDSGFRDYLIQGEVHDDNAALLGGIAGHAGLFSCAPDLLRFARCILVGGRTPTGQQLFRPATVAAFTTRAALPPDSSRALGWDTPSTPSSSGIYFSPRSVGHLGYSGTSLWLDLDRQLAVVLLTNRTCAPAGSPVPTQDAIRRLRPAFHNAVVRALPAEG